MVSQLLKYFVRHTVSYFVLRIFDQNRYYGALDYVPLSTDYFNPLTVAIWAARGLNGPSRLPPVHACGFYRALGSTLPQIADCPKIFLTQLTPSRFFRDGRRQRKAHFTGIRTAERPSTETFVPLVKLLVRSMSDRNEPLAAAQACKLSTHVPYWRTACTAPSRRTPS